MVVLRRFVSVFAVALAVLVTVQTLDLVACADETEQSADGHTDHGEGTTLADCLCHVTFTRTEMLPAVAAAPATPPPPYAPFVTRPTSTDGEAVEHVPLA